MISICFEIKTKCNFCGNPLPINALVNDAFCSKCNKTNELNNELWLSLLDDAVKETPDFESKQAQTSTVFTGEYTFNYLFGKMDARCDKCKTKVETDLIEGLLDKGIYECKKCKNEISVRSAPKFLSEKFPSAKWVIGEDDNMFTSKKKEYKLPASAKPVLFTCPSCAGNLEIDGSDRMITCEFCDSQIYLPDDLWFRLHPPKIIERWYLCLDESVIQEKLPYWYHVADVTVDRAGNLYVASADDGEEDFVVWSLGPDLKTRWTRKGLMYHYDDTGITIAEGKSLYLWNKDKHSLLKLSSSDGSTIMKLKGKQKTEEEPYPFNMMGCDGLICDKDGTILTLINDKIVRFNPDGSRASLWHEAPKSKEDVIVKEKGFFDKLISTFRRDDSKIDISEEYSSSSPDVNELGAKPQNIDSDYTRINLGWDGYLYMMGRSSSDGELAKYDRSGTKIWSVVVPLQSKDCKPCTDSKGNVYIVGKKNGGYTNLIRFSQVTKTFEIVLTDVLEGGVLKGEEHLAVSPDGTIFLLDYYHKLKIFNPDGSLKYITEQSKEEDKEALDELRESKEKDERF